MTERDCRFVQFDLHRLDEEWVDQPRLFLEWSDQYANAKAELADMEAELEVMEAEAKDKQRAACCAMKSTDRPTETAIKDRVCLLPQVQELKKEIREQQHKVDLLKGVVDTLNFHRKPGLEKAVDLHGQQYFSKPKATANMREAVADIEHRDFVRRSTKKERP